LGSYSSMDIS